MPRSAGTPSGQGIRGCACRSAARRAGSGPGPRPAAPRALAATADRAAAGRRGRRRPTAASRDRIATQPTVVLRTGTDSGRRSRARPRPDAPAAAGTAQAHDGAGTAPVDRSRDRARAGAARADARVRLSGAALPRPARRRSSSCESSQAQQRATIGQLTDRVGEVERSGVHQGAGPRTIPDGRAGHEGLRRAARAAGRRPDAGRSGRSRRRTWYGALWSALRTADRPDGP